MNNSNKVPCQRRSTWLAVGVCWYCWVIQTLPSGGNESGEAVEANSIRIAQALSPVMFHNEAVSSQDTKAISCILAFPNECSSLHSSSVYQKHWWLLGTASFQYTDHIDYSLLHIPWTFFLLFFLKVKKKGIKKGALTKNRSWVVLENFKDI